MKRVAGPGNEGADQMTRRFPISDRPLSLFSLSLSLFFLSFLVPFFFSCLVLWFLARLPGRGRRWLRSGERRRGLQVRRERAWVVRLGRRATNGVDGLVQDGGGGTTKGAVCSVRAVSVQCVWRCAALLQFVGRVRGKTMMTTACGRPGQWTVGVDVGVDRDVGRRRQVCSAAGITWEWGVGGGERAAHAVHVQPVSIGHGTFLLPRRVLLHLPHGPQVRSALSCPACACLAEPPLRLPPRLQQLPWNRGTHY